MLLGISLKVGKWSFCVYQSFFYFVVVVVVIIVLCVVPCDIVSFSFIIAGSYKVCKDLTWPHFDLS